MPKLAMLAAKLGVSEAEVRGMHENLAGLAAAEGLDDHLNDGVVAQHLRRTPRPAPCSRTRSSGSGGDAGDNRRRHVSDSDECRRQLDRTPLGQGSVLVQRAKDPGHGRRMLASLTTRGREAAGSLTGQPES